jgi:protein TonB
VSTRKTPPSSSRPLPPAPPAPRAALATGDDLRPLDVVPAAPQDPAYSWITDPQQRPLLIALGASVVAHALMAAVHFTTPEPPRQAAKDTGLEVILVNGRTESAPVEQKVLAQANIDGGGDHAEGRAKSPLANSSVTLDGDAVTAAQRRQAELEAKQRELMAQMKKAEQAAPPKPVSEPQPDAPVTATNRDTSVPMARQLAEIASRIEDYNKRPRKHFFAPSTSEYRFAQYVEDWRQRIEAVGNLNYPAAARGKVYGSLRMTVYIRSDGSVERIEFDKSSEHSILNDAARRTVQLAAPFAPFPASIARDTDVLAITRTWRFTNDKLTATAG